MSFSLDERIILLSSIPFFAQFKATEIQALAAMMEEVSYPENTAIVREDDIVNDIFVIVDGFLEVTQQISGSSLQLKVLASGDTIGLSASGFFSQTGLRTATVTTFSPVILLSLKVSLLYDFLKNSSLKDAELFHTSALFLKVDLIKRVTLFSSLPADKISALSSSVERITVDADTTIFEQGEVGDKCYLVFSGELVVTIKDSDTEEERTLTTLQSPMIFGETSLLTDSPRNASVRTTTVCELLVIHKQQLQEILKDNEAAQYASYLVVTRSRPKHYSYVIPYHREMSDGEKITILKHPELGRYYRLSRMGWYIWQLLDGKHTLQEIAEDVFKNFLFFSPEVVAQLVSSLIAGGFVQIPMGSEKKYELPALKLPWQQAIFKYLTKVMEIQCSIKHTDQFVTKLYKRVGYLFFNVPVQFIFLVLLICGMFLFASLTQTALVGLKTASFWLILTYIPLTLVSVVCHEFAHALTTKAFGFEVLRLGFGWYWFGPIAFADTSDMWLGTRRQRIIVNAAGVYVDMVFAGGACIIAALCVDHYPHLAGVLWLFALFNYLRVFANLDPTLMFDGYYILMDLLNKPNLRKETVLFLVEKLPSTGYRWKKLRKYKKEFIYIFVCLAFLAISVYLVLLLQKSVVGAFLPGLVENPTFLYNCFRWGLPILMILFSGMGVYTEIREQQIRAKVGKKT